MTCRTSRRGIGHPSQGPRLVPTCMKNLLRRARLGVSCRRRPKRWVRRNLGNRWESQTKASAVVRFLRELPTFHRLASHRKERIYICRASSFSLGIRFKKSYRNFRSCIHFSICSYNEKLIRTCDKKCPTKKRGCECPTAFGSDSWRSSVRRGASLSVSYREETHNQERISVYIHKKRQTKN